ncbi:MAG TPA: serine hydrolase domain-containing protein [Lentisphaeria bacterium]|nr:serine hydrolase domain-containing protein [Lentisphaeria bacterium]
MTVFTPCPPPLPQLLAEAVAERAWPAAVLGVAAADGRVWVSYAGRHRFDEKAQAVSPDDLFDLASLTKVIVSTTLAMLLHEQGRLPLDAPVTDYLPEFAQAGSPEQTAWRRQVTVRHLLTHSTGLPAGRPFHRTHADVASDIERHALVLATPLATEPGRTAVYSDLGMIILGELLMRIANQSLDQLARDLIFTPLHMHDTTYNPPADWRSRCLPTEQKSGSEGEFWQGVVHDENARWLGGVAGHAGLFANISDLLRFAVMMLQGGKGPAGRFLKPETIAQFTSRARLVPDSSRCLGWDSLGGDCPAAGQDAPPECFGHGGFTGVSIWFNPKAGRAAILLTNAVHPLRQCKENGLVNWRRRINNIALNHAQD